MLRLSVQQVRTPTSRKSIAEVKALLLKRQNVFPAVRSLQSMKLSTVRPGIPLRLRGGRLLRLSASLTDAKQAELSTVMFTETSPVGAPMPSDYEKVKILKSEDLKKNGRLIVVGDVHGCYDEFCALLEACHFDRKEDTLIMAGDLVNKGPDSLKVLKKAMKLKAIVVRGNHEDNALGAYYAYNRGEEIAEKYEWVKELKKRHVTYLESLPFAIKIPSRKLIVVHAGLVPGTDLVQQDMFSMYRMRDVRKCAIRDSWIPLERSIEESIPWASQWQGPEHVIFGHDSSRRLQFHPYATGIDTGAVQGDHLSACVFPRFSEIPDLDGPAIRENLGMEIVSVDVDGPKKVVYPKAPSELSKAQISSLTVTDNLCMDMYRSFQERNERESGATA